MEIYTPRTDLALEATEMIKEKQSLRMQNEGQLPTGMTVDYTELENIKISKIVISTPGAAKAVGKEVGNYATLEVSEMVTFGPEDFKRVSENIAAELTDILNKNNVGEDYQNKRRTALVVGLGNWNITADSLGPKTVSKIMVTRHLTQYMPDSLDERIEPVSCISPGVLGITGIETAEIIDGVIDKVKPDVVIAIDSLASRKISRVNSTIQIADTGIAPGSGLGNRRMELSKATLGIPVIAIGVPTVVDATTFAYDALEALNDERQMNIFPNGMDDNDRYGMLKKLLGEEISSLVVTPKDIDESMEKLSGAIAGGINLAMHDGLSLEEIHDFML